jgi:hypothetical protein
MARSSAAAYTSASFASSQTVDMAPAQSAAPNAAHGDRVTRARSHASAPAASAVQSAEKLLTAAAVESGHTSSRQLRASIT